MKQKILDATHGGLDIILYYYPQARECVDGRAKAFKMRPSERTASACIKQFNGVWRVTDFGDGGTALSPFDIAMHAECLPFSQTLFLLADRYGVDNRISAEVNKPKISHRKAKAGEKEGDFSYKAKTTPTAGELAVMGAFVKATTMERYNYFALESYTITKADANGTLKTTTFESTDTYPIFMHDCGEFQKIYKPLEYNKAYRFFYRGTKPKDYINGLAELRRAYDKLVESEEWKDDESPTKGKKKLPEAIFCSGERDALNIAGLGYFPLWLNSETAMLDERDFAEIQRMVEKVYNIPDIDDTGIRRGRELALRYLDIYTVELPEWLKQYKDNRGRPRKDLRDFLELRPYNGEFIKLLANAPQCKFWRVEETEKGTKTNINTAHLLWFLRCNGFAKITDKVSHEDKYIRIIDYRVEAYTPKQIRSFVKADLEQRMVGTEVVNLYLNSKRTGVSLADDLRTADISFVKNTHNSRTFFFENKCVTVYADRIEEQHNSDTKAYTWVENISPHRFKLLDPAFRITANASGVQQLDLLNTDSHFARFLINASRIYWREEFENRISTVAEENEAYAHDFKFNLFGERLTFDEKAEQARHFVNKVYTLGYILHRFKFDSKSMAVWIMENKLTDEDESAGGSGKSFFLKAIKKLALSSIVTLQGRDRKSTENKHLLDRVSSNTDLLLIDDAHRFFDFDFFYTMITGETTINPKGGKSFEIAYEDSPIMAITSNFPPPNDDGSTMRRMLNVVFSDYYHQKTPTNDYRESRSIYDDFGYDIFGVEYREEWYNQDINFMLNCLQFYLSTIPYKGVFQPPMENVIKRINIAKMGNSFKDWAEGYFSPDGDNLNVLLNRAEVFNRFKLDTGNNNWKMQRFTKALQAFVANSDYIDELNPKELLNKQSRLLRKSGTQKIECIYLHEIGKPINNNFKDFYE